MASLHSAKIVTNLAECIGVLVGPDGFSSHLARLASGRPLDGQVKGGGCRRDVCGTDLFARPGLWRSPTQGGLSTARGEAFAPWRNGFQESLLDHLE